MHIPLYQHKLIVAYTVVGWQDYVSLMKYKWRLSDNGYVIRNEWTGYTCITLYMHREILGLSHGTRGQKDHVQADHKNGNKLDNHRSNLRIATHHQNAQNLRATGRGTSIYRNVSWDKKSKKWKVQLRVNGEALYFGMFKDENEAGDVAAKQRAKFMPFAEEWT